jgi:uncharacterized membrane protein YjdF
MKSKVRKVINSRNLMWFVFCTFVGTIIYVIVRIAIVPNVAPDVENTLPRVKSDYVLMLLQGLLGVAAILVPNLLRKKIPLSVPSFMIVMYALFLYAAIYLGEARNFYHRFPQWDSILHMFSGIALGALGFSVVGLLNRSEKITFKLSPFFVSLFAFCFAMTLGVIWEIYEFWMDYIFGMNMQKHSTEDGTPFVGQAALLDTMKDLMVDALGAGSISIIGYVSLKYEKDWLERIRIKHKEEDL